MKLSIAAFLTIGILLISGVAFAQEGLSGGAISISASEKGFFEPDTADLVFAVATTEKSVVLAATENANKAEVLVGKLEGLINGSTGDYVKTLKYSVQPVYELNVKQKKNTLTGYMVTNQVLVKTHQTDTVGRIIDQALAAGANRMESIDFTLVKQTAYCGVLIARAAVNAKQQAQALASSLGVKLGKIKSASPTCGRVPRYGFTMMGAKAQGPAKTPIEAGQIELKATVNIVFRIE